MTSALIGIYAQFTGRGPERAFTFHHGNVLVTVMRGVLTPAGRSLATQGATELLDEVRRGIRTTMEADFRLAVERLTGQPVLAFLGGNSIEPDVSAEIFLLGGSL